MRSQFRVTFVIPIPTLFSNSFLLIIFKLQLQVPIATYHIKFE